MTRSRAALLTVVVIATTSPATAAFVVDTGTPTGIVSPALSPSQSLAGYFTLGSNTIVSSVEGYIFAAPSSRGITINIHRDGIFPNDTEILFTSTFTPSPSMSTEDWKGISGVNWNLAAGSYWVSFATTGSNSMRSGVPSALARYASTSESAWRALDDFALGIRIGGRPTVAAVPEPTTWAMIIAGFGMVGGALRNRNTRRRVAKVSYA